MGHGFISGLLAVLAVISSLGLLAMWRSMPVKKLCPRKRDVRYRNGRMN